MRRIWRMIPLLTPLLCFTGCNLLYLPFYFFTPEPSVPPKWKTLATKEKDKKVTVAIVAWSDLSAQEGLLHADREISLYLATHLNQWVKYNEENVKIVHPRRIAEFKNEHPEWKELSPREIGKVLEVDYVIYLEIRELKLYEKGAGQELFRGRAKIQVSLANLKDEDDFESGLSREFTHTFPKSGPKPRDLDLSVPAFKEAFFNSVGRELSWWFTKHPRIKHYAHD